MKTFYTSNYATAGSNPKAVAISNVRDIPNGYQGAAHFALAPDAALLDHYHGQKISHDEYAEQYIGLLTSRGLTAAEVAELFADGTIFICYDYEDSENICHRTILGEWLTNAGVAKVTEL